MFLPEGVICRVSCRLLSTARVVSGTADPPKSSLILKPFQLGGLCEAVIIMPEANPILLTVKETAGEETALFESRVFIPAPDKTSAAARAKFSDWNRLS